jgi:hypothetical protein
MPLDLVAHVAKSIERSGSGLSMVFGDDRSGVRLTGDADDVAQLIAQATAERGTGGIHEQCTT